MAKKKILLIEDDRDLSKIISFQIEEWGFDVVAALDGEDGLLKAKEEAPSLIILDLILPKLPGEEVCRQLKKDESLRDIPVIMLTAKAEDVDRIVGRVIGADCYLTKPFDAQELLEEINTLMNRVL